MQTRATGAFVALALVLSWAGLASADEIVGNLNETVRGQDLSVVTNGAEIFTMGPTSEQLADVKLLLNDNGGSLSDVAIFSDNGGQPGASLLDLGAITPTIPGDAVYTVTPSSLLNLVANTSYWVEVTHGSGPRVWDYTDSKFWGGSGTLGNGNGTFAASEDGGASWLTFSGSNGAPYQMQVDGSVAAITPEPGSLTMLGAGGLAGLGLARWRKRKHAA